jgi:hypothetical protein
MHSFSTRPLLLTILTAVLVYAVTLPIITSAWQSRAADIIVCVLWYLYTAFLVYVCYDFATDFFQQQMSVRDSLWGFFNTLVSGIHVLGALGMSIWLLDKGAFVGIVDSSNRYHIYYTYFLTTASDFILQTGFLTAVPSNGSAAGATFGILGGLFGLFFIVIIFTLVARPVQRAISGNKPIRL